MPAQLKIYTDSVHTSEVAHTPQNTTATAGGTQAIGTTTLQVVSTAGMPAQGYVDIDSGGNLETLPYSAIVDSTHLALAKATTISHANGVAVVQWGYVLAVGDQTNGILNDGTNAAPNGGTNVATWYLYNAGDQPAQSTGLTTSNASPSTSLGFSDSLISITGAGSGFAASVSPGTINAGAEQQFWLVAEVGSGQSPAANPQLCVIGISYQSV